MTAINFTQRSAEALANPQLRANFRRAMDGLMSKRREAFPDAEELDALRNLGEAIRRSALAKLPELLTKLEQRCLNNDINVHWAETTQRANAIVLDILHRHRATRIIKGKSMVSEEMRVNKFLEQHDIECLESDLGEYIIQLAKEAPSHIIMPAIHKNRDQIAQLFADQDAQGEPGQDAQTLTATARQRLREKFAQADAGISGVNFAVAETGTLCLVENEGNGRMSTTAPAVHIAVMGIEKVVEKLLHVAPLLTLLTRSATGQPITTYVNMITSPRKAGDKDGPREVHLLLLDNGRSRIYANPLLRPTLQCIRCGACMNHCPVYTRIGGHAYHAVYPGPIGKILMPQLEGLDKMGELATASSLCGACAEVCPVRIPIPDILLQLRQAGVSPTAGDGVAGQGARRTLVEALGWKLWRWWHGDGLRYRIFGALLTRLPMPNVGVLRKWTRTRVKPRPAQRTLHALMRARERSS